MRPLPPTTHLRAMGPEPAAQKQPPPRKRSRRASGLSAGGAARSSADTPDPRPEGRIPSFREPAKLKRSTPHSSILPGKEMAFSLFVTFHILPCVSGKGRH
ncbi:neuroepithelial cell-transforming gene 1 protein-like [Manis pentadactyla]|uniref:neuroepithelial cell-transforming gene 1 protein-like n=1 Tax=Manis pentadactyla TaxID=143292 RepID=UPI00255D0185|nr:neuroepithelial cell-transforming gene 1 protein-like [Manis pentadactyla]